MLHFYTLRWDIHSSKRKSDLKNGYSFIHGYRWLLQLFLFIYFRLFFNKLVQSCHNLLIPFKEKKNVNLSVMCGLQTANPYSRDWEHFVSANVAKCGSKTWLVHLRAVIDPLWITTNSVCPFEFIPPKITSCPKLIFAKFSTYNLAAYFGSGRIYQHCRSISRVAGSPKPY